MRARYGRPVMQIPHAGVDGRGTHLDEHLALPDDRILEVPELQHVGRAVAVLDDPLHGGASCALDVYGVHVTSHGRCTAYTCQVASEAAQSTAREPLTRQRVLAAAVAVADRGGVEALSMRKLAQELDVVPMALYRHVAEQGRRCSTAWSTSSSARSIPPRPDRLAGSRAAADPLGPPDAPAPPVGRPRCSSRAPSRRPP